jgi:hypothetical protein
MEKKRFNIHGIISILLFFIVMGIGVVSIAIHSISLSLISLLTISLALVAASIFYCSKCKCRNNCNHWIFGKISILLSKYNPEKYTNYDLILGTIMPFLIAIAFPQYWLVKSPVLFVSYWGLSIIAGLDIYFFVCNNCLNDKCSMCRKKSTIRY